ncbi:MAG: hypothetical protein ACM3XS_01550 [Bacteroidota bacterium]
MRRGWFVRAAIAALTLAAAVPALRAAAQRDPAEGRRPQADLAWFMAGLRELGRTRDAKLKLTAAQAKKILPELEALRAEKILLTDLADRQRERGQGTGAGGWAGGSGGGRQMSEEDRKRLADRQRKTAERIAKALDKMEAALKQNQVDLILNMDFDASQYGLGGFRRAAGEPGSFNRSEMEKMRREMQAGLERLVKLNREVLEMLRKLAK